MVYNAKVSLDLRSHIQRLQTHLEMVDAAGGDEESRSFRPTVGGIVLFPCVLLFCWTFATINRIQNMAAPDKPQFWLFVLHVALGNAQPIFHTILFASTNTVRREWSGLCGGRTPDGNVDDRSLLGHVDNDTEEDSDTKVSVEPKRRSSSLLADVSYKVRAAYQLQLGVYDMFGIMNYDATGNEEDIVHVLAGYAYQTEEQRKRQDRKRLHDAQVDLENDEDDDGHGGGGHGTTTTYGAFFTLFKSFVGLGVLALPSAFKESGYMLGSSLLILIAAVSYYCMKLLLDCKYIILKKQSGDNDDDESGKVVASGTDDGSVDDVASKKTLTSKRTSRLTFGEVGRLAVGDWGKTAVELSMVVMQVGAGIGYLIFIGENVAAVADETGSGFRGCKETMIILFAAASVPLIWLRTIKHLVIPALVADVIIVFGLVTIFGYDFGRLRDVHESANSWRMRGIPLFFGIAVFAFEGIGMVLPVETSMKEPERFGGVLRKTMALLTTIFMLVGAISYGAYGEETEDIILFSLPQADKLVQTVQILYCLGIFMTLPVMLFPALRILERYSYYRTWFRGQQKIHRTAVVAASAGIAMAVPKFGLFINVVGAVAGSLLAFILPSIFFMQLDEHTGWKDWKCLLCLTFGTVGGIVSLIVSVMEFFK